MMTQGMMSMATMWITMHDEDVDAAADDADDNIEEGYGWMDGWMEGRRDDTTILLLLLMMTIMTKMPAIALVSLHISQRRIVNVPKDAEASVQC